jgi:hypothetical protein
MMLGAERQHLWRPVVPLVVQVNVGAFTAPDLAGVGHHDLPLTDRALDFLMGRNALRMSPCVAPTRLGVLRADLLGIPLTVALAASRDTVRPGADVWRDPWLFAFAGFTQ